MPSDSFSAVPLVASQVRVLDIALRIVDAVPAAGEEPAVPKIYSGQYSFDRLSSTGAVVDTRSGGLIQHLTPTQITQVRAFLDAMLTKAQGSI
jgi:hypothetical protein